MNRKRKKHKADPLDELVRGRADVKVNQTGAGKHKDRRTRRARARDAQERQAVRDQEE